MKEGNSVSSPTRQYFGSPRKSRSSPSTLRRSKARAEAYQHKKRLFETKAAEKECVPDTNFLNVPVPEVLPVAGRKQIEIDENTEYTCSFSDDFKSFDDDAKTNKDVIEDDAQTNKDVIEDDVTTDDNDESTDSDDSTDSDATTYSDANTDDDTSNDVSGSDLGYIVLCENYVTELKFGFTHVRMTGLHKEFAQTYGNRINELTLDKFKRYHKTHLWKVHYGFLSGGGFLVNLLENDYDDLYLYSNVYKCDSSQWKNKFT